MLNLLKKHQKKKENKKLEFGIEMGFLNNLNILSKH